MNRQVPETQKTKPVAIVGNGKMAKHMIRYFELVGQPYVHWFRQTNSSSTASLTNLSRLARFKQKINKIFNPTDGSLTVCIADVTKVLLLIPDDQIENFIQSNPILQNKTVIHFSGSLFTDKAQGCHPLMTFGDQLYDLATYQSIPFVVDDQVEFSQLFPLFDNTVHSIKPEHKIMYHAMCVMAGNFSQMMWQAIGKEMEQLDLPQDLMSAYLKQNTENFITNPENSATGPFVRGDFNTIKAHQMALLNQPLAGIYQAFYDLNQQQTVRPKRSQV